MCRRALEQDDGHVKSMCHLATLLAAATQDDEAKALIARALEADADADEEDKYAWLTANSARFLGEQQGHSKKQKAAPVDVD